MSEGSSVTLVFYRISADSWYKEPALNLIAAAAQLSTYTHVELSIGEVLPNLPALLAECTPSASPPDSTTRLLFCTQAAGSGGQMANVVRIYNDPVGVVRKCPIRTSNAKSKTNTCVSSPLGRNFASAREGIHR